MPRARRLSSFVIVALLVTAGCGAEEKAASDRSSDAGSESTEPAPSGQSTAAETAKPKPQGTAIDITFTGDTVKPDGVRKKVKAGKPILLRIKADQPGELHVHSSPEQQIAYPAGTSRKKLTIDQPGVVDVESHDLDRLVVQLEVR